MKKTNYIFFVLPTLAFLGCHGGKDSADEEFSRVKTPVTVTAVSKAPIHETISLNATSSFLKKNIVRSNTTGFIEKVFVTVGDNVQAGMPLFTIRTKEADALSKSDKTGNPNPVFAFKGEITVTAQSSGTITETDRQVHDYISDGDQLGIIADQSSFVFLMNLPFELNKYANVGTACSIQLPDSTVLQGTVSSRLSSVDAVSQTQSFIVKPVTHPLLPENLLVVVQLSKSTKTSTQVISKSAVLSDETLEHFWVMKLINDSTAVKVPVSKGITSDGKIEITAPLFESTDRILNTGNYGLPDTAYVTVINP